MFAAAMSDVLKDLHKSYRKKDRDSSKRSRKMKTEEVEKASPSENADDEGATKTDIDEDDVIAKNVEYITSFIEQLSSREKEEMSGRAKEKLKDLKCVLGRWLTGEENSVTKAEVYASGARPKTVANSQLKKRKVESSSSSESNNDSSSGSDSYEASSESSLSDQRTSKKKGKKSKSDLVKLSEVLGKLNKGRIPDLENFDERSGQSLERYLRKFEKYCKENVNGGKSGWISELSNHLEGKTLRAFKAVRGVEDDYDMVRDKLLEWYGDSKENRKAKNIERFESMIYRSGQDLYLFCCELENAYVLAYPKHSANSSSVLQRKFMATIPRSARKMLGSYRMFNRVADKNMSWRHIKKWAKVYDSEIEVEEGYKRDDERDLITIDIGQELLRQNSNAKEHRVFHSRGNRNNAPYSSGVDVGTSTRNYHGNGNNFRAFDNKRYSHSNPGNYGRSQNYLIILKVKHSELLKQ